MEGDRTIRALSRIEAALARIEASSRRVASSGGELRALQGKHDRLRSAVQSSLEELDQLIESAQG